MFGLEMGTFNIDDGFPEAAVRALSKGFLREEQYSNLIACNNLAEFKLILDETDYGKYILQNDGGPLDVNQLKRNMYRKLRDEIEYMMGQASQPLQQFLEKMMHCYQIENVVSFISGVKNNQDPAITIASMNPLGEFQGLKSVSSFASEDFVTLFQDILIDLPVGDYFRKFIDSIISYIGNDQNQGVVGREDRVTVEDIS